MDKKQLKEQVETIRQAFGYIQRFQGETFVIKIESSLINHTFFPVLIKDLVLLHQMGIRIALIPGSKNRIDEILETYGIRYSRVNGIRISPPEAISAIRMAAFDVCNGVMTLLAENNTNAIIGNWVRARAIGVRDGVDYQSSGAVEKLQVDVVNKTLDQGLIPIFPNIGWSAKGKPYNISSNELAYAVATQLKAAKLFFVTDFRGVSTRKFQPPPNVYVSTDRTIPQMTVREAEKFLDVNSNHKHSLPLELVTLALDACRHDVRRVHIVDGRVEGMVLKEIFSNRGFGTMIYANQHDNIRGMQPGDIPEVLRIMKPAVDDDILVPRTAADLEEKTEAYAVYEVDGTIHGCCALHVFSNKSAELAGLAVDTAYANFGIGKRMVSFCIDKAIKLKVRTLFVLTTQTSDWFSELGFEEGSVEDLPKEREQYYNKKRKSRILVYKASRRGSAKRIMSE